MSVEQQTPPPSRKRAAREDVDAKSRERRYRPSEDSEGIDFNLWVDPAKLDPDFQYRWVNVTKNRTERLYNRDWDLVSEAEAGFSVERHADIAPGARENTVAVLMRKRKDWFQQDQDAKQARIDEQMARAARGDEIIGGKGQDEGGGLKAENAYKPQGQNKL